MLLKVIRAMIPSITNLTRLTSMSNITSTNTICQPVLPLVHTLNYIQFASFTQVHRERKIRARIEKGPHKVKTHHGAFQRFMVVGSYGSHMFMHKRSNKNHKMRHKTRNNKLSKRRMRPVVTKGIVRRLKKLIPYYKRKKYAL